MTEDRDSFLLRRQRRAASQELTQMLVLGYGIGFLALGVGSYKYAISPDAWDALWKPVAYFGLVAVIATLFIPFVWYWPERALRAFGNRVGGLLMNGLLAIVYFAIVWPFGWLLRATRGADPIYRWQIRPPEGMEGWHVKELPADVRTGAGGVGPPRGRLGLWAVLRFFVRGGHYALIPGILVLVSIGIVLFFLQTSVIAPFIYTLF